MTTTNPHKWGTKAAERWDAKRAKEKALEELRERCRQAGKKIPEGFQGFGYVRTQAWLKAAMRAAALSEQKRPALAAMDNTLLVIKMITTNEWSAEDCAKYLQQ